MKQIMFVAFILSLTIAKPASAQWGLGNIGCLGVDQLTCVTMQNLGVVNLGGAVMDNAIRDFQIRQAMGQWGGSLPIGYPGQPNMGGRGVSRNGTMVAGAAIGAAVGGAIGSRRPSENGGTQAVKGAVIGGVIGGAAGWIAGDVMKDRRNGAAAVTTGADGFYSIRNTTGYVAEIKDGNRKVVTLGPGQAAQISEPKNGLVAVVKVPVGGRIQHAEVELVSTDGTTWEVPNP